MHAFLIIGKNEKTVDKTITKYISRLEATRLNYEVHGIEDVRELKKHIKLARSNKTCVVIKNIDQTSNETLNAFLKSLEEPQRNLYYLLTANKKAKLHKTILSR